MTFKRPSRFRGRPACGIQDGGLQPDGSDREEKRTVPVKKSNLKLYAAPLALLMMAAGFGAPTASADLKQRPTVSASYAYSRSATAEEIHAGLQRTAERMCRTPGPRPAYLRRLENACVASAMADGIARIGRKDVAEVHGRWRG